MRARTLLAALVLIQLAGCTMIPELKKPELPVAGQWDAAPLSTESEQAAGSIGWRQFFISDQLQTLVDTTLAQNRDLRVAALNVAAVRALYRIERAALLPAVNVEGAAARQHTADAQDTFGRGGLTTSDYTANLAVTGFELDLFGRLRSLNEAALESYFATEAARDAAQISLVAEVANAYLQWLADRKLLELTGATLTAQEQSRELVSKRFESGVASKLDLVQVSSAVETARAAQALYTRRVMQDRNAIYQLMGSKQEGDLPDGLKLEDIRVMDDLPVDLPSEVLLLRPDVRQAEHQLRAANADIGAARAAFFPRITLTGSFGFASNDLSRLFSSAGFGAWSLVPRVSAPIFEAGRNRANLEFTEVQKEIAAANYEKTIQNAFREVADELAARATLDDELGAQRRQVAATREAYDLAYARYKGGIESFLSVLDAQRVLFAAQQRQIDIEKQRLANLVNLYKVLGGGLNETNTPPTTN